MNVKNLKNILHKVMYKDTADVYRAKLEKVGRTDDYSRNFELIHEKIPCAHRDDKSQKLTEDLRLTCDSEIEILPNDFLKVQHQSQEFELVAGVAFNYPTHKEISVRRRKEAGQ